MISDAHPMLAQESATKLKALIAALREQPALRERDMNEFDRMGYLLDRCGMDNSQQRRFVYDLQERCRGALPTGLIQDFNHLALGTFAEHLARTSWDKATSNVGPG